MSSGIMHSFMGNFKIGTRLFFLIGILTIVPVTIGALAYYGIATTDETLEGVYDHRLLPIELLGDMDDALMAAIIEIYLGQKHDPAVAESVYHEKTHNVQKHIDAAREEMASLHKAINELKERQIDAEEIKLTKELEDTVRTLESQGINEMLRLMESRNFDQGYELAAYRLSDMFHDTEVVMDKLIEKSREDARDEMDEADARNTAITMVVIVSILVGVVFSAILGLMILRSITAPLNQMVDRVRDIAEGEGDLTKRLDLESRDELGDLAVGLNRFIVKIHDLVVEIAKATDSVTSSSGQLSGASESLSSSTEESSRQSESIAGSSVQLSQNMQVVSSSIEEMSISISEVARKAAEAASIASEANRSAENANQTVAALGQEAGEIGTVIESIVMIAQQTNLLALNAAIEAAGAGEAGKGFAVVASEVKELARQAGDSSEEIKRKLEGIKDSTVGAVDVIQGIAKVIVQVNDITESIASAVEEQSITTKEIANNVSQASVASADVTKNIEGISSASKEGAKDAAAVLDMSNEMKKLSDDLNGLVGQFKINRV